MPHMDLLRCGAGTYYVGSARNLDERMQQHFLGQGASYTAKRMPVDLAYAEDFERIDEAYAREKQVQGWSRAKREALIERRYAELPGLSRRSQPD